MCGYITTLHCKLLSSRPPDDTFRHYDPLLIRERDGERKGFPLSHGQITRESPAGTGEIPDCALPVEGTSVVRDSALHRKATIGANQGGHGVLAGGPILGGREGRRKGRAVVQDSRHSISDRS